MTETLQNLTTQASEWRERIDQLEAGHVVDRGAALAALMRLLDLSQNLRDAILSEDSTAAWRTKEELHTLVSRLDDAAAKRRKILDLAARLTAGTVTHRRQRTREERLAERDAAVRELMEKSAQTQTPDLPGPVADKWLEWACSLDDQTAGEVLKALNREFPRLDDFVRQLEIEMWHDGALSEEPVSHEAEVTEPPVKTEEAPVSEPLSFVLPDVRAEQTAAEPPVITPQIVEAELPEPEFHVDPKGFFPLDEVELLAMHAAKARRNGHPRRTVRALVATSQWLTPWDQNPVFYPGGGVAEEIGYAGKPALASTSPADAEELLASSDELHLLTGGADLLRWSLEEADRGRVDAVTGLRRLTQDQLRQWFGEVFKIELSEPQVQDMYRLTYGIPLLVSELHKRVVPLHDTPPTWLGFAIWTQIKLAYEAQLQAVTHELKNGPPAVRLSDREVELLKMVVLASDNSTGETLAANLMDNWSLYQRPDLTPVSSEDHTSLRVLAMLGLLPVKNGNLVQPVKALAVVDADDPIRKIAKSL
ncbi:MAG: hypothetical protein P4L40_22450 [Terracidiphilus sp.]|nr:hypothetical protein [Terracidiphilus sp.]